MNMNKKLVVILVLLMFVLTGFTTVNFSTQNASASPPITGDKAFSNSSFSTSTAIAQTGSSSTWSNVFAESGNVNVNVSVKDAHNNVSNSNLINQSINPSVIRVFGTPGQQLSVTVSSSQNPTDAGVNWYIWFNSTASGGTGTYYYNFELNGTSVQNSSTSTYKHMFPYTGSYSISVYVWASGDHYTGSASLTETVDKYPFVSFTASPHNTVDVGQSYTLTMTVSGGISPYKYYFYNGLTELQGGTSSTYTTSQSTTGNYWYNDSYAIDAVGAIMYTTIKITVDPALTVSITSSKNPIDYGQSVTFTATASGGSGSYSYQWYMNGSVVSGATSSTWTTTTLPVASGSSGGDKVSVDVTDSNSFTVPSDIISMAVYSDVTVSITSSKNPADVGQSVEFTSSVTGGSGGYSYQWYLNGTAVSGATLSTWTTTTLPTGSPTVYVKVTDTDSYTAQSNTISETVYKDPTVSISTNPATIDYGQSVTFTASPSGGSGSFTYQWYLNGSAVSGATSSTWTTTSLPTGSPTVYVIIIDSDSYSVTSNTITETVHVDVSATISSSSNPSIVNNTVTFTASASGGSGSYTSYAFYLNSVLKQSGSSATWSVEFTSIGNYSVYVVVTDSLSGTGTSSTITQQVKSPALSVSITSNINPADFGIKVTFTATATGGSGSYTTYVFYVNGVQESSQSSNVFSYTFTSTGSQTVLVKVTDSSSNTASTQMTETVNSDMSISSISSTVNPSVVNYQFTLSISVSAGTPSYSYHWYTSAGVLVGTSSTYSTSESTPGGYSFYVKITDAGGGSVTSATFTETVNPSLSASVSSSKNPSSIGVIVTFTATATGGSGTYTKYVFYLNGVSQQNSASSTWSYNFTSAGNYSVYVVVTDSLNDNFQTPTITEKVVTVLYTVTLSSSANPSYVGQKVYFNATVSGGTAPYTYTFYVKFTSAYFQSNSYTYTITEYQNCWNSSYIYFNYTILSGVSFSNIHFSSTVTNLTLAVHNSPVHAFLISYSTLSPYSVTEYTAKSTYNMSGWQNTSSSSSINVKIATTEVVNYYTTFTSQPSGSYVTGAGSQVQLTFTTSESIANEKENISINWGDGLYTVLNYQLAGSFTETHFYSGSYTDSFTRTERIYVTVQNIPNYDPVQYSLITTSNGVNYTFSTLMIPSPPSTLLIVGQYVWMNLTNYHVAYSSVTATVNGIATTPVNVNSNSWKLTSPQFALTFDILVVWTFYAPQITISETIQYAANYIPTTNSTYLVALYSNKATHSYPILLGVGLYPINLTNVPSGSGVYQQRIEINMTMYSLNSQGSNIGFFAPNGTQEYAWLESINGTNATYWVKNYNGSSTIDMKVYTGSTNLFSSTGYLGEAPQLSSTYGEYDNGKYVFVDYWNFVGTSLPSGWTSSGSVTVNNGITVAYSGYAYTTSSYGHNSALIFDFYGNYPTATSRNDAGGGFVTDGSGYAGIYAGWGLDNVNSQGNTINAIAETATSSTSYTLGLKGGISATGYNVWSIYYPSSGGYIRFMYNYTHSENLTTTLPTASYPFGWVNVKSTQVPLGPFYWFRVRDYVSSMPTYVIGGRKNLDVPYHEPFVYQQLLNIPTPAKYGINPTGSNIQFTSTNGTLLYAWIQSINSSMMTVWVRTYNTSLAINMEILPEYEDAFSSNGYLGYGTTYFNAPKVFTYAWNFMNISSLPSGLSLVGSFNDNSNGLVIGSGGLLYTNFNDFFPYYSLAQVSIPNFNKGNQSDFFTDWNPSSGERVFSTVNTGTSGGYYSAYETGTGSSGSAHISFSEYNQSVSYQAWQSTTNSNTYYTNINGTGVTSKMTGYTTGTGPFAFGAEISVPYQMDISYWVISSDNFTSMPDFEISPPFIFEASATIYNTTRQHYATFAPYEYNLTQGMYTYVIPDSFDSNYITIFYNYSWTLEYASYHYEQGFMVTSGGDIPFITFINVAGIQQISLTFNEPIVIGQPLGTMSLGVLPSIAINGYAFFELPSDLLHWTAGGSPVNPNGFSVIVGEPVNIRAFSGSNVQVYNKTVTPDSLNYFLQTYVNITEVQFSNLNSTDEVEVSATSNGAIQGAVLLSPYGTGLSSQDLYLPSGNYSWQYTEINYTTGQVIRTVNVAPSTYNGVSWITIAGFTIYQLGNELKYSNNSIESVIQSLKIIISLSDSQIKNLTLGISLNLSAENTSIANLFTKVISNETFIASLINNNNISMTQKISTLDTTIKLLQSNVSALFNFTNSLLNNVNLSMQNKLNVIDSLIQSNQVSLNTKLNYIGTILNSSMITVNTKINFMDSLLNSTYISIQNKISFADSLLNTTFINLRNSIEYIDTLVNNTNISILNELKSVNSTLYNQLITVMTQISNVNSSIHTQLITVLTQLKNDNSTIYNQTVAMISKINNVNTTILTQIAIILNHLSNVNSTLYNQTLKVYSAIINSNSTLYQQTLTILTKIKNYNSTIYNQTLDIITKINNENTTLYNQMVTVLTKIENTNTTLYNQMVTVLTKLKNDNSTVYNQTLKILTQLSNYNSSIYSQTLKIITDITNTNTTIKNEALTIITDLKNDNSTIYNQTLKILTHITNINTTVINQITSVLTALRNDNSTIYNETVKLYSAVINSNSTLYQQTLSILAKIKNYNSTIYNQTLSIITKINNVNTTLYNQIISVLAKISNVNTTLYDQIVNVLVKLNNYNSTIYNQTLKIISSINNVNTTIYGQTLKIITDIMNTNSSLYKQTITILTKLSNYNSTIYNQTLNIISKINNMNTTIVNQMTNLLVTLKNDNSTLYNETLKMYSAIINTNSTIYKQTISILTQLKDVNSTLYNQTLKIITNIDNVNTTLYNQLINVLTNIKNTNTTIYDQILGVIADMKNYNSSIYNQTLEILTHISNYNSTLYEQTLKILSYITSTNSTINKEEIAILNQLSIYNSSIYNQTIDIRDTLSFVSSLLTNVNFNITTKVDFLDSLINSTSISIENKLTTLHSIMNNVSLNITTKISFMDSLLNSTKFNITNKINFVDSLLNSTSLSIEDKVAFVNATLNSVNLSIQNRLDFIVSTIQNMNTTILSKITTTNSSIGSQMLNVLTNINNLNDTIKSQYTNVVTIINNIMNNIDKSSLNITTKILTLHTLLLENINSSIGYKLTFGTPIINNNNTTFPVFIYNIDGTPANLTITQNVSRSLQLEYISPTEQFYVSYKIYDVKSGTFMLSVYNLSSFEENNIRNQSAVITATTSPIKTGPVSHTGAGLITSSNIPAQPGFTTFIQNIMTPILYKISIFDMMLVALLFLGVYVFRRKYHNVIFKHSIYASYIVALYFMLMIYLMYIHGVV